MKLTTKKIIAREFLILTLASTLGLISFFCIYPYNAFKRKQVQENLSEISMRIKKADSLALPFTTKLNQHKWFYSKFSNHGNLISDKINSPEKMWTRLNFLALKDSIAYKWLNIWPEDFITINKQIGFITPEDLETYIVKNRITKVDSANYNASLELYTDIYALVQNKLDREAQIYSFKDQIKFGVKALIICIILLFGFRYMYYSLKWSLKTIKQKPE